MVGGFLSEQFEQVDVVGEGGKNFKLSYFTQYLQYMFVNKRRSNEFMYLLQSKNLRKCCEK